ncbi:MAG: bifunctional adenosylcobinamide kinase/adenosylcobinamide-phosphate guanylyltransferase [Planctomycetota bacterium]|jgi:adenosylcobinamide kinase/adenosylcobinamide-phosphate guanylyltransferase|nr:bifunctional adenosylcobinamide kinase/adenosylcobinamide-phosphate guanylyltransferase [Planctomycetota bacterium]
MSRLVIVLGGARSGKSAYALRLAETESAPGKTFIATCPVLDDEMRVRVERHRAERAGRGWCTLEEEVDLAGAIRSTPDGDVVLVDCLTLWINNIMYRAGAGDLPDERDVSGLAASVVDAARGRRGLVVMVASEVGLGIVPGSPLSRHFRDLAGRVNQFVAKAADEAVFMAAGLPLRLK